MHPSRSDGPLACAPVNVASFGPTFLLALAAMKRRCGSWPPRADNFPRRIIREESLDYTGQMASAIGAERENILRGARLPLECPLGPAKKA